MGNRDHAAYEAEQQILRYFAILPAIWFTSDRLLQLLVEQETKVENKSNNPLKITIGKATVEVTPGFDEVTFQSVIRILSQC